MSNTTKPQYPQNIFSSQPQPVTFLRPRSGVGQDNRPPGRETAEWGEPQTASAPPVNRQPKHHGSEKRQTESVSGRIPAHLKIELLRIAKQNGWSESYTVRTAIQEFVENSLGQKFGARVSAIVTHAIDTRMRARDNRFVALLVRIALETGQIRGIVTNHLAIQPGMKQEDVQTVLVESEKEAKANIKRRTPQIAEMIEELKHWMAEKEGKIPET